jgi:hypothetical protein
MSLNVNREREIINQMKRTAEERKKERERERESKK